MNCGIIMSFVYVINGNNKNRSLQFKKKDEFYLARKGRLIK